MLAEDLDKKMASYLELKKKLALDEEEIKRLKQQNNLLNEKYKKIMNGGASYTLFIIICHKNKAHQIHIKYHSPFQIHFPIELGKFLNLIIIIIFL